MNLVKEKVAEMKGIPEEKELVEALQKAIFEITFNKLDGEERIMTCTKITDMIPEDKRPKTDKPPVARFVSWSISTLPVPLRFSPPL